MLLPDVDLSLSLPHKPHHRLNHLASSFRSNCFRRHIDFKNRAEGVTVGDVEEAQGADGGVDVDGGEVLPKDALIDAAFVELVDRFERGHIHALDAFALHKKFSAIDVFVHHEADVIFVACMMVEGEFQDRKSVV